MEVWGFMISTYRMYSKASILAQLYVFEFDMFDIVSFYSLQTLKMNKVFIRFMRGKLSCNVRYLVGGSI